MVENRVFFKDNPWPEGHPISNFQWSTKIVDGDVWFDLHLESANYYSEREIEDDEDTEYPSDWAAPIVWGNYHSCTISSKEWHAGGFKVCSVVEYCPDYIDGLELHLDTEPESIEDWDADLAFHIYLLGHDAVACHKLVFEKASESDSFNIYWSAKIAQAYVGDYEFKHQFKAIITSVPFPKLARG